MAVGAAAEATVACRAARRIWYRERPPPWSVPVGVERESVMGARWREVTPGSKIRSRWVSGMPEPSSRTVRCLKRRALSNEAT
jgi:hypothetical protein